MRTIQRTNGRQFGHGVGTTVALVLRHHFTPFQLFTTSSQPRSSPTPDYVLTSLSLPGLAQLWQWHLLFEKWQLGRESPDRRGASTSGTGRSK